MKNFLFVCFLSIWHEVAITSVMVLTGAWNFLLPHFRIFLYGFLNLNELE